MTTAKSESPVAMIQWGPTDRYWNGYEIGSEDEDGSHMRSIEGWPYSIYRKGRLSGVGDMVLCRGIQNMDDALALRGMLNCDWRERHGQDD
jgi:hypothetical protein